MSAVVSDAGAGGQVLMCSDTFKAVAHLTEELGCVGPEGVSYRNLYSVKGAWSKLFGYVLYNCIASTQG